VKKHHHTARDLVIMASWLKLKSPVNKVLIICHEDFIVEGAEASLYADAYNSELALACTKSELMQVRNKC
jgi:hypothetical protein